MGELHDMHPKIGSIYTKLAAIQAETSAVEKTGEVNFKGTSYKHFQEHGLLGMVKPLLHKHGVALIPSAVTYSKSGNSTVVDFKVTLVDVDDPTSNITVEFPNEGVDSGDKGFNKAYTGAMKYALQKLFLVPTEKLDEQEGSTEHHNQVRTAAISGQGADLLVKQLEGVEATPLRLRMAAMGVPIREDEFGHIDLATTVRALSTEQGRELYAWADQ